MICHVSLLTHIDETKLITKHFDGTLIPVLGGDQYKRAKYKSFRLNIATPNNCVTVIENQVILIKKFLKKDDNSFPIIRRKFI